MDFFSGAPIFRTIFLLFLSNCFMTAAWFGHLRFKGASIFTAVFMSWLLALPEYSLQVPANRLGYGSLSAYQLKIIQEAITLIVFSLFAWAFLGEVPTWRSVLSLVLIFSSVAVAFSK